MPASGSEIDIRWLRVSSWKYFEQSRWLLKKIASSLDPKFIAFFKRLHSRHWFTTTTHNLQPQQATPTTTAICRWRCSCFRSEFSDIMWIILEFSNICNTELRFNWERLNRTAAACVGKPQLQSGYRSWLRLEVAVVYGALIGGKLNYYSKIYFVWNFELLSYPSIFWCNVRSYT